ncbi:GNAT family N-acetyltransferase [Deinococcus sp. HMF7604]|uniref:GNAT family N-acetyltransferase n=1 Tax=Deinococcus betulae TaxID=2873312 RepID=UPI001CCE868C|nr:GNAT family N-acetyltransferase [Deinococcus betulae]MBZ9749581.1 GNAT family N-acetyltransferase [Deinococcus betulae]
MPTSLAYFTDLSLRRLEGAQIERGPAATVIRSPHNPTFWWGNFLLMPAPPQPGDLTRWEEAFVAAHPGTTHRTFGVDTPGGDEGAADEFRAAGYGVHEDTVLTTTRTVPPTRLNRDAERRPLGSAADWDAALALRLAVNAASPEPLDSEAYCEFARRKLASYRAMQAAGQGAVFGAFEADGTMLSGLGIFDAGQGVARYQSVETHPEARSRGLAGTLVHTAAEWARQTLGTRTLVIVADPGYHAQALYERVGFRPTETQLGIERRPAEDQAWSG